MPTPSKKKMDYCRRLLTSLNDYKAFLFITADHVGSKHMQNIRRELRGRAELLMGKNTLIRRALRDPETLGLDPVIPKNPAWDEIVPRIRANVGFLFSNNDMKQLKDDVVANQVGAPAKAGVKAPCDVIVPKGPTGMDPTQTSFFQALNIPTMISRGQIEIKGDVHLVHEGDRVGPSEAALLTKLNIRPFKYGLKVVGLYQEGQVYPAKVLDITDADVLKRFSESVYNVACLSLRIGYPTIASVPHSLVHAYKNVIAVSVATDYTFEGSEKIKAYLENPEAFAAEVAADAPADNEAEDEDEEEEEEEEESDADLGGGLFGGDDDDW